MVDKRAANGRMKKQVVRVEKNAGGEAATDFAHAFWF
jgi:hypothetical protein